MVFSHFKVFYGFEVEEFNKNTFTLPTHTGDLQNQVSWGNFLKSDILILVTFKTKFPEGTSSKVTIPLISLMDFSDVMLFYCF